MEVVSSFAQKHPGAKLWPQMHPIVSSYYGVPQLSLGNMLYCREHRSRTAAYRCSYDHGMLEDHQGHTRCVLPIDLQHDVPRDKTLAWTSRELRQQVSDAQSLGCVLLLRPAMTNTSFVSLVESSR